MSHATKTAGAAESVLISIRNWPAKVPDQQTMIPSYPEAKTLSSPHSVHLDLRNSKTGSSPPSTHMSLRIQKKIIHYDQIIAGFHQRRWS